MAHIQFTVEILEKDYQTNEVQTLLADVEDEKGYSNLKLLDTQAGSNSFGELVSCLAFEGEFDDMNVFVGQLQKIVNSYNRSNGIWDDFCACEDRFRRDADGTEYTAELLYWGDGDQSPLIDAERLKRELDAVQGDAAKMAIVNKTLDDFLDKPLGEGVGFNE